MHPPLDGAAFQALASAEVQVEGFHNTDVRRKLAWLAIYLCQAVVCGLFEIAHAIREAR